MTDNITISVVNQKQESIALFYPVINNELILPVLLRIAYMCHKDNNSKTESVN